MKFLLTAVNAKYIHSNPAIHSLRAYAGEELQPYIELAEYTINQHMQDILADIYKRKPSVIGFSCYIWNWNMIQDLLAEIPKILPDTDIWLGGPEVTYDAEQILKKYPHVKGIMIGEGEATFRELLDYYVKKEREENALAGNKEKPDIENNLAGLQNIAGLCLAGGYTPMRELTDLSQIPFLYQDLKPFENRILYYETSRGCPYRCSYCLSSIDKKVRLRDMSVIEKELQFFLDNKVPQVKFIDRTFNCNHEHAMAVWKYLYEHDNGVTNFHFEISADILREDEIALLNQFRPGLAQLEIGVQSTNERTIGAINRVMDVDKLERIVKAIHNGHNIHLHLDLIAGLPYEDYDSFARSFNRVYGMRPEQLQLGFLKVLKGSGMQEEAEEYQICYLDKPPYEILHTPWLPYEDVLRLKRIEEMVELYYNSSQYTHTLPFLEKAFPTPFAMYEQLALFYEKNGYFINSPARAYRYQVLLRFAAQYDGEHLDIYKELLTYDMYLRENLKSRPDFAYDLEEVAGGDGDCGRSAKETIREFYRREEQERRLLPAYEGYDWKQLGKMTHMEPFFYPVWDAEKLCLQCREDKPDISPGEKELRYVLFDYQKRNPLNHEADTQIIDLWGV